MSTIVTRAGKGSPLSTLELDTNFTNLNTDKLEINAALGTPASVTLTNATGLPTAGLVDNAVTDAKLRDSAGLSVIGRGANSTGDPADIVAGTNHQVLRRDGSSLAFGAVDLSSNQAVTGTLPVNQGGTGITSFGSGIATWLGTPSSANLAAAVTDETGTGALVFANSPTLVTPALGTPASGVVTNLTGTASININGTVGATTPAAGAFTTLSATSPATFQAGTAALPAITTSGDTNTGLFFPSADVLAASTAGSERIRITSTGNVGINTSNIPTASILHVRSADPVLTIQDTETAFASTYAKIVTTGTAGDGTPRTDVQWLFGSEGTAFTFSYGSTPTERARFDSSGNLGLGTTAPVSLFEVQGGLTTSGAIVTLSSKETSTVANDVLGRLNFRAALDAAGGDAILTGASIVALAEGTFSATSNATSLLFQTGSSEAATTKMRLDSAGNLGLGVTPSAWNTGENGVLQLPRGAAVVGSGNGSNGITGIYQNAFFDGAWKYIANGFASNFYVDSLAGIQVWRLAPQNTSGAGAALTWTQAMTLTAAGNLGIGTTTPDANLTVNGAASFAAGTALLPSIARSGDLNTGFWFPAADTIAASTAGNERLRITSTGNVGIGTTVPRFGLHLAKSGGNDVYGGLDGNINSFIIRGNVYFDIPNARSQPIANGFQTQITLSNFDGTLRFFTSPSSNNVGDEATLTERLRITSAGDVGIGTTSPAAKLSVDGSAIFNESGADVDFRVESNSNTHALFVDAGNSRVGINKSNPGVALDITGEIRQNDAVTVYADDNLAGVTATTGTITFTFDASGGSTRYVALIKISVAGFSNSNAVSTDTCFAEYIFGTLAYSDGGYGILSPTVIYEHNFDATTDFASASTGSTTFTVTLTNPLAETLTQGGYKVEIIGMAGLVFLTSVAYA